MIKRIAMGMFYWGLMIFWIAVVSSWVISALGLSNIEFCDLSSFETFLSGMFFGFICCFVGFIIDFIFGVDYRSEKC